ncbi:SRPBCC family protein [Engelhardtia mirabilis]|uniref:Polyketide cyclase / dehydrase and lipid transport n=1 Tax=Engelhardtia mirabilis TaxID=2528011 RepID=A0A518BIL0_9BACT|nr:Polyketide cyclase / dehydrase and lipid transport [Planctomycetes bacterium Pla133]QDV01145.1 Polyketide cyclase / dehydrase and lipid transport [Planctomycetes bacterium Pla86]
MEIEHQIDIAVPPAELYPRIATSAGQLEWIGGLVSAAPTEGSADALPEVGTRFRQRLERGPIHIDLEGRVTVAQAPIRFGFEAEGRDVTFTVQVELVAAGSGTRMRQKTVVGLGNFALKLMSGKIRSELDQKQTEDLARLKQLAEA